MGSLVDRAEGVERGLGEHTGVVEPAVAVEGADRGHFVARQVEVEHRERIQRVTVGANDGPADDRRQLAAMPELAEGAHFDDLAKIDVSMGTVVVVDGNRDGNAQRRSRERDEARCSQHYRSFHRDSLPLLVIVYERR